MRGFKVAAFPLSRQMQKLRICAESELIEETGSGGRWWLMGGGWWMVDGGYTYELLPLKRVPEPLYASTASNLRAIDTYKCGLTAYTFLLSHSVHFSHPRPTHHRLSRTKTSSFSTVTAIRSDRLMRHKRVSNGEEWFGTGAVCEIQEDIALYSNNKSVVSDEQKRREDRVT